MTTGSIEQLNNFFVIVPTLLQKISEADFSFKPEPKKWSKKEILGHLIDSAANNHHRFVRAQFEDVPIITYDQNKWNEFSYYQQFKVDQLIQFWKFYNLQLVELVRLIPASNLEKECNTGGQSNVTLQWLFEDYVSHLEHHLRQILEVGRK